MDKDSLVNEVIEYMKGKDDLTVSMLQRKFKIGYSLGSEILDILEKRGYLITDEKTGIRKVFNQLLI